MKWCILYTNDISIHIINPTVHLLTSQLGQVGGHRGTVWGTAKVRLTSWDCSQTGPVDQRSPWRQNAPRVHPRISGTRISKSQMWTSRRWISLKHVVKKKTDGFIIMFAIARAFLSVYNPRAWNFWTTHGQPWATGQRSAILTNPGHEDLP